MEEIKCDINTIGFVSVGLYSCRVYDALVASCATVHIGVHETKWTSHVKRKSDVAQSYTSSVSS